MKKRILSIFMVFVLAFLVTACRSNDEEGNNEEVTQQPTTGRFTPGTYEGKATGYGGEITATVVLSADRIDSITCTGENETNGIGSIAVAELPQAMVAAQSVNVDSVTGATRSSEGVKEAVTQALTSAGVDVASLNAEGNTQNNEIVRTDETITADVVVIGAGGAGMTAAIEAANNGADVLIVEKMPMAGGNTSYATGGMNAAETSLQEENGVDDTVEIFVEDTMKGGNYTNNEELVRVLAENSAEGVEWLETIGAPLESLTTSGGATNKRMHAPKGGSAVGSYMVKALKAKIDELGIEVLYNTEATDLIVEEGQVDGVKAQSDTVNYTIDCEAVVLATGGFGANSDMVTKYNPELKGFKTTNAPSITGDGILMAERVGANVIDMEQIQVHPTVEQETSTLITESVRGYGGILVNQNGERFFNELSTRNLVSQAIMEQEGGYAYLIFDQQVRDKLAAIETYISAGLVEEAENLTDLAELIGVDAETLQTTVADYNNVITNQTDDEFERTTGMDQPINKAPFYAIKVAPAVHHTMGGVQIDTEAEVISTSGDPIPGLFAAGEVTGGVHGENRIGGNAVADIVVFGRIAGQNAADYVENN